LKKLKGFSEEANFKLGDGIEEHLKNLSKEDLIKLAFQCEKYHNKLLYGESRPIMGGLHDYIWRLNEDQIREIILKEIKEHPEINSLEKLKGLYYGVPRSEEVVVMLDEGTEPTENKSYLEEAPEQNYPRYNKSKKIKIKKIIKRMIKKADREELFSIIDKLLSEIRFADQEVIDKLDYMRSKELRKFILKFVCKNFDELDEKEYFSDLE